MDFKDKYFKYKDKYLKLKLKKQIGGGNIKIIKISDNQEIIINDIAISSQMEILVNKVYKKMTNGFKLSKFLFNFTDNSEIELNDTDFNIINIIFKKITNSLTQEEENFLNELLGIKKVTTVAEKEEVDTTLFFKYEYINPIPDSLIVTEIDTLFSLLFSLDKYQLFSSNMRVAYYMPTRELIEIRLKFLIDFGIQDPVLVFNKEKKDTENKYNELKKIYSLFETLFIKSLTIDYSKSNGHTNVGIIELDDHRYFYKILNTQSINTLDPTSLLRNYEFIKACKNFNIDNEYTYEDNKYKLHFVSVPLKVIFSIDKDFINIGYLMEIVEGDTIRKIKKEYNIYWKLNETLIKTALHKLVDVLTEKKFLIVDLNDDNVMWNKETKTLTYIDIDVQSFLRPDKVHYNNSLHAYIDRVF